MIHNLLKPTLRLLLVFLMGTTLSFAQGENINLQAGNYDQDPYTKFNPNGSILGTYTIRASKSAHTFTDGQFTINIAFPAGAVYAGGANLPAGFSILEGIDGSSAVVIGITGNWSGTGPTALRTFVIPIRIVGLADDQPTATVLQWLDPFVTENPVANSTGSPLTVSDPLPVTLVSFEAAKEGQTAVISWVTSAETNSDRFEVEHSLNGKNWYRIGIVASHGESMILRNYTFTDEAPVNGENLYRLRMVDKDGTFAYSRIRSISFEGSAKDLSIYPNPTSDYISVRDFNKVKNISVIDTFGNEVSSVSNSRPITVSTCQINVKSLSNGIYFVKITRLDGALSTHKLLINK